MSSIFTTQLSIKEGLNKAKLRKGLLKYIQEFSVLCMKKNKKFTIDTGNRELGLVILNGRCTVNIEGKIFKDIGVRKHVFDGKPTAVYFPIETKFEILSQGVTLALCYGKCEKKTEFSIIYPDQVKVMQVGKDNWQREVRTIIGPNSPSVNLIVGETINPAGNWSGTPPHKHERMRYPEESLHEELYYFKTDKPQGFGIQRFYSYDKKINELIYLRDNTITFMPYGYHQIVAGPGYTLYYLFFLSGIGKDLIGYPDPTHKWLNR